MHELYARTSARLPAYLGLVPAAEADRRQGRRATTPAGRIPWSAGPDAGTAAALGGAYIGACPHAPEEGLTHANITVALSRKATQC
jgi:hypothetical protein